jgi:hypothetical protein
MVVPCQTDVALGDTCMEYLASGQI